MTCKAWPANIFRKKTCLTPILWEIFRIFFSIFFSLTETLHNLIHPVRHWLADITVSLDGYYNQTNESMERRAFTPCLVLGLSSTVEQTQRLTFFTQYCGSFISWVKQTIARSRKSYLKEWTTKLYCHELSEPYCQTRVHDFFNWSIIYCAPKLIHMGPSIWDVGRCSRFLNPTSLQSAVFLLLSIGEFDQFLTKICQRLKWMVPILKSNE